MSRYSITISSPARTDDNAIIGYEPPLRTYFVQAFENLKTEWRDIWLGTRLGEFPALTLLIEALALKGVEVSRLTAGMSDAMASEAARPARPSLAERLVAARLTHPGVAAMPRRPASHSFRSHGRRYSVRRMVSRETLRKGRGLL